MLKTILVKYHERLALNSLSSSDFTDAEKNFLRIIRLSPQRQGAHYNLALTYLSMKRFGEARAMLDREADLHGETPQANQARAELAFLEGHREEAAACLHRVIEDTPDEPSRTYLRMRLNICRNEASFTSARQAVALLEQGNKLSEEKNYEGAEALFLEAASKDPSCYQALNNLGAIAMNIRKDFKKARAYFVKADRIMPIKVIRKNIARLNQILEKG